MPDPRFLDESTSWRVCGLRRARIFFAAVGDLLPDATLIFLEGSPETAVAALLAEHAAADAYGAPAGTLWSWPRRSHRFSVRCSRLLLGELARISSHHAEPEICSHLHFYHDTQPLAQWYDAFDEPLLVSHAVTRGAVDRFCAATGGEIR